MTKFKNFLLLGSLIIININLFSQSRAELKNQITQLSQKITNLETQVVDINNEKETIKIKLDKISNIVVDEVITPNEQPKDIVVGESGWRIELNGNKYKSDLIGQLGTIWILDSNKQLQPQGAISLTDYKIEPNIINPDKEILYKKFISKGTKFEGSGGVPFASITAGMANDQFSQFTINIEGTSLIKPKITDLRKISIEASNLFSIYNKGVFICTGMHVIRYNSRIFSKSEGDGKITSPVVNIAGNFYGESNEESTEYLVVRQLTQLNKQSNNDTTKTIQLITNVTKENSTNLEIQSASARLSPEEVLTYFLKRQPSLEEIIEYQNDPEMFLIKLGLFKNLNTKEKTLLEINSKKLVKVPNEFKSVE